MDQSAWEVRRDIEQTRQDLDEDLDALGEKMSPRQAVRRRTDRMRGTLTSVRERVMGTAEDASSNLASGAGSVRDKAAGMASTVSETASGAADTIKSQADGNPIAVGVVAFGFGALIGSMLPETKTERDAAPQLREHLVEPIKHTATDAARDVTQELKGSAEDAADRIKESAQQGAEHVRDDAHHQIDEMKGQIEGKSRETDAQE
jgi:Protein of unknown function (DUF3618)